MGIDCPVLYHYTDFNALHSVLTNRELRVNNVLNMNDATEMLFFMTELRKAVLRRLEEKGTGPEVMERINLLFQRDEKREFTHSAYAACFSRCRDDAAQWERYGSKGRGVCIAFHRDLLDKVATGPLSLQEVCYYDNVDNHTLVQLLCRLAEKGNIHPDDPLVQNIMEQAWISSASFKHPSFASESEVRLVVSPFVDECLGIRPRYHVAANRIKKYYPLNLDTMCSEANVELEELISEIIIGPESTQSLPILQDYLDDIGFHTLAGKIVHSDCPLRHSAERL